MFRKLQRAVFPVILVWLLAPAALAEGDNATMSIKVTALNGRPIDPPQASLVVAPGDQLVTKIFVKNFSPNNDELRAYQATMDYASYSSGEAGRIVPKDYDATTGDGKENKANSFIDTSDPDYVHHGLGTLAIVDTISFGYRYLGVLVNRGDAIKCPRKDKLYSCGTLNLEVSEDAAGTFTIRLARDHKASVLRDNNGVQVLPFDFDDLVLIVATGGPVLRVISSVPEHRGIVAASGSAAYGDRFDLVFSGDATTLSAADLRIEDGTKSPPKPTRLLPAGKIVTVVMDREWHPGRYTTITHTPSGSVIQIGCLPGDVNGSGVTNGADLQALIEGLRSQGTVALYHGDINGDGSISVADVLGIIDIINNGQRHRLAQP